MVYSYVVFYRDRPISLEGSPVLYSARDRLARPKWIIVGTAKYTCRYRRIFVVLLFFFFVQLVAIYIYNYTATILYRGYAAANLLRSKDNTRRRRRFAIRRNLVFRDELIHTRSIYAIFTRVHDHSHCAQVKTVVWYSHCHRRGGGGGLHAAQTKEYAINTCAKRFVVIIIIERCHTTAAKDIFLIFFRIQFALDNVCRFSCWPYYTYTSYIHHRCQHNIHIITVPGNAPRNDPITTTRIAIRV